MDVDSDVRSCTDILLLKEISTPGAGVEISYSQSVLRLIPFHEDFVKDARLLLEIAGHYLILTSYPYIALPSSNHR